MLDEGTKDDATVSSLYYYLGFSYMATLSSLVLFALCVAFHHHAVAVDAARGMLASPLKSAQVGISKDALSPNSSVVYSNDMINPNANYWFNQIRHMAWTRSRRDSYYGVKVTLSVHELPIVGRRQTSSALIQLENNDQPDGRVDVLEAGWHVSPEMYEDANTHLYISWQAGDEICYNLLCNGFVLIQGYAAFPGMILETQASGVPHYITLIISRAQSGDWYLSFHNNTVTTNIGYWPASLFRGLANKATQIRLGGAVTTPADAREDPPMGSGHHGVDGEGAAASFTEIQLLDQYGNKYNYDHFDIVADNPRCYDVMVPPDYNDDLAHFYYGGPWGCKV